MADLVLSGDWVRAVHQVPGCPIGAGPAEQRTVVGALARRARETPDALFLSEIDGAARAVTYGQAHRWVRRRAATLAAFGLRRGERAAVLGQTSIDVALAVLAILEAGGVAVALSPQDPPDRTARNVEFTEARFVLSDEAGALAARSCGAASHVLTFDQLDRSAPDPVAMAACEPAATDAALIFFTSGTTAAPKAVVQSHYAVAHNARTLAAHHRIGPQTRMLCVLPLHHVNGLGFTIFGAMLGGGHTLLARGFDALRFWPTVYEHDVHIASLVPSLLRLIAMRPGLKGERANPLRYAVSAAAPLSTDLARQVHERLGLRIVQGYGLTEVTNFSCLMPTALPTDAYERWMLAGRRPSVGPALTGHHVEVMRDGDPAPPGVEGEIVIRGPSVMSGYLNDRAATDHAFRGGWFHTGDLGYLLPGEGGRYLHISGRIREIAKRAGEQVSLLEVDEVLASIPGVADAGAAAFANTWVDEEIAGVVVRDAGCVLSEDDVIEHCRKVLPFAAIPKRIDFVDELPRTSSGKIRRVELAERFVEYRDRLFVAPPEPTPAATAIFDATSDCPE